MPTHAIISFTGSHILIDATEHEQLKSLSSDAWFESRSGERIKGSAIAEILPVNAYYNRFPAKRPEERPEFFAEEETQTLEEIAFSHKNKARGLLEGLRLFCLANPSAKHARALYAEKLQKFKDTFQTENRPYL